MTLRVLQVTIDEEELTIELADGRRVSAPLASFPRLLHADHSQRSNWRLLGDGQCIRWPDVDEDIGVEELFRGTK